MRVLLCVLFLLGSLFLSSVSAHVDVISPLIPGFDSIQYTEYGLINTSHSTILPNYDSVTGQHIHYIVNNLPANTTGTVATFAALFTPNPVVTGQEYQITLHVARPTAQDDITSTTRQVTYIQSTTISYTQSGVVVPVFDAGLVMQVGDFLALSIPNNAINLHIGTQNIGSPVSYARALVELNSSDDQRVATFVTVTEGQQIQQICMMYGTYGTGTYGGGAWDGYDYFQRPPYDVIQNDGEMTELKIALQCHGVSLCPTSTVKNIQILFARETVRGNGVWRVDRTRSRTIAIQSDTFYFTTAGQLPTKAGDLIGFHPVDSSYKVAFDTSPQPSFFTFIRTGQSGTLSSSSGYTVRFIVKARSGIQGDPQFAGFQGQSFQFHGLADEHFNLISTPTMQLNSHFVYLSSGKCDYNDTLCFQHPGTYLDVLGFKIPSPQGSVLIKVIAGSHDAGLRLFMGQHEDKLEEMTPSARALTWTLNNDTAQHASVKYENKGQVEISTPIIHMKVINSNDFFNLEISLLDRGLLRSGAPRHSITDHDLCQHDKHAHAHAHGHGEDDSHDTHDHGLVEQAIMKKYHADYPLHGLIGQTWRNVRVCGKHWIGDVTDYVVSDLFGGDYFYNYFFTSA